MNSPHHQHHDVHQQRVLWFFSFCNQRSSSSGSSSSSNGPTRRSGRRKSCASTRNKFALQYQQQLERQQKQSSNVFGLELVEHTQLFGDEDLVPHIVKACSKFIEEHGIIFGIYRLSGMRVNIHKLRQDFDKNPKISEINSEAILSDAHAVACVLKQYFRELPTPLLTFHMYEKFIELFRKSKVNTNNNNNEEANNGGDNHRVLKASNTIDTCVTESAITNNSQVESKINNTDETNQELTERNSDQSDGDDGVVRTTTAPQLATKKSTSATPITKLKSKSAMDPNDNPETSQSTNGAARRHFKSSVSDSHLLSLSSVVTTTCSDVKYYVKLDELKKLLLQLPRPHYQTLKYLMRHLAFIAANGEKTGMDSKNVAIVWAPNLLKPRELELSAGLETLQVIGLQAVITEQLIKHHKFLFDDEDIRDHGHRGEDIESSDDDDEVINNHADNEDDDDDDDNRESTSN